MKLVSNRYVVGLVLVMFVTYALPGPVAGKGSFAGGKATAEEAASLSAADSSGPRAADYPGQLAVLIPAYAQPDTTEFEFPEEETKHLYRDITVFLIASAFVGYFIVKVFLQGDTEEEKEEDGGKQIPVN